MKTATFGALALAGSVAHATTPPAGIAAQRWVSIILENTDYSKASADPSLANLAKQGITLSNYFGLTHPSEPNYVASVGGDYFGIDNDNFNAVDKNVSTVVDLLEDKGVSWGIYQEDMPYTGFQGMSYPNPKTKANMYVRKHNPTVQFDANTTPARLANQKNTTLFYQDLASGSLPQWIYITPNMTSDGHDTSVTTAGTWTKNFLAPYLNNASSPMWKDTLILITFDETHTYTQGNRVFSILLGGAVPSNLVGTTDSHFYNHYSQISTVEANWGLHTLGRWDVGANVFDFVAKQTGDGYQPYDAATGSNPSVFLNASTAGPFASSNAKQGPYVAPNLCIKSPKTGRTVLPAIAQMWAGNRQTVYTDSSNVPDGQHPAQLFTPSCGSKGRGEDPDGCPDEDDDDESNDYN